MGTLDINAGQKILIRLRPAFDRDAFLQEDELLGTMLHELTHNVHGPHDQNFYKFLAGLEKELEDLQRSGYAGEGFHSRGHKLGSGGPFRRVPQHTVRLRALQAAEERRRNHPIQTGGVRLGGGNLANLGLTTRELAALAADMRAEDAKRCGTGDKAREEAEVQKALRESIKTAGFGLSDGNDSDDDIIVLDGPSIPVASSSCEAESSSRPALVQSTRPRPPPINHSSRPIPASSAWACTVCTLVNDGSAKSCEACEVPRLVQTPEAPRQPMNRAPIAFQQPPQPQHVDTTKVHVPEPIKWDCRTCGEKGMEHEYWMCRWCGSVKSESVVGR